MKREEFGTEMGFGKSGFTSNGFIPSQAQNPFHSLPCLGQQAEQTTLLILQIRKHIMLPKGE